MQSVSTYVYRGGSMLGTFHPGDRLTVEPVPLSDLERGDVIAFVGPNPDGGRGECVHRLVGFVPGGLLTRGDNVPRVDRQTVTADLLLGKVTHVERGGLRRPVRGGLAGLWRARLIWCRIPARNLMIAWGRGPYRWLHRKCIGRFWHPKIDTVRLAGREGELVKYLYRGRTVARWWPETGRYECRWPFDLVIPRPDDSSVGREER